jgi:hypothetical protein
VERILVVEPKAVKSLEDIFFATTRSYMKAIGVDDGVLLNFASMPLMLKRVGREQSTYQTQGDPVESGNQELRQTGDPRP